MIESLLVALRGTGVAQPLVPVFIVLCLAGCESPAVSNGAEADYGRPIGCLSDADCAVDESCQFGLCSPVEPTELAVSLQFSPPDYRSDLVAQQVVNVPIRIGQSLPDFALAAPVRVSGAVSYSGISGLVGSADVRLRRVDGIPGQEFATNVTTSRNSGTFSVLLPPGFYDITVAPEYANLPRYQVRNVEVGTLGVNACPEDSSTFCQLWSFALPAPEDHVALRGVVERRIDGMNMPVAGARVSAASADGSIVTTEAVTDTSGAFVVFVPPRDQNYVFTVRRSQDSSGGELSLDLPVLEFSPYEFSREADDARVVLSIGDLALPARVTGRVMARDGTGTANAVVLIHGRQEASPLEPGAQHVTQSVLSRTLTSEDLSAEGDFHAELPPGRYEVIAAGTEPATGVSSVADLTIGPGDVSYRGGPVELQLSGSVAVSGTIVHDQRAPQSGVTVSAELLEIDARPAELFPVTRALFGQTVESSADGSFEMQLAPGTYSLVAVPAAESGLARTSGVLVVDGIHATPELRLEPGGAVAGRIISVDGTPIAGATVEAWTTDPTNPALIDRAVADERGQYRLVIAAP
jgi:hypothetical protein